jgi:hypothetical protein
VPEILPVPLFSDSPEGSDGDIKKPLELIAPPELVTAIGIIAVLAVTDWVAFEMEIDGAAGID